MSQANRRRSIPIVDKAFQYKYTAIMVLIAAVVSALLGGLLLQSYWELNRIMDLAMSDPDIRDKVDSAQALRVFQISAAFLVLEVLIVGLMGLIITHRVCGPVFVIHRQLASMLEGKYPHIRPLRDGDEFRETYKVLTALVESFRKREAEEADKLQQAIVAARQKGMLESDVALLEQLVAEKRLRAASEAAV
jgi:signal transduction histidine kinase